jgi:hypothetical protein
MAHQGASAERFTDRDSRSMNDNWSAGGLTIRLAILVGFPPRYCGHGIRIRPIGRSELLPVTTFVRECGQRIFPRLPESWRATRRDSPYADPRRPWKSTSIPTTAKTRPHYPNLGSRAPLSMLWQSVHSEFYFCDVRTRLWPFNAVIVRQGLCKVGDLR